MFRKPFQVKHPGGSQKQRRHLWPATCPSIDHRGAPALFLEGFCHDERRAGPSDSGCPHPTRQPETRRSRPRPAAEQGVINHDRRGFARSSQTSVGYNFGTFAPDPDTVLRTLNLSGGATNSAAAPRWLVDCTICREAIAAKAVASQDGQDPSGPVVSRPLSLPCGTQHRRGGPSLTAHLDTREHERTLRRRLCRPWRRS
jgi:hypothetical protein